MTSTTLAGSKVADLAGPGIGDYAELPRSSRRLPLAADPARDPGGDLRVEAHIEDGLCRELGLHGPGAAHRRCRVGRQRHARPGRLADAGRSSTSRTTGRPPRRRPGRAGRHQVEAGGALRQFGMRPGEGLCTDMRAVRKDYFLDHDHSAYVDQWDWERAITAEDREPRLPQGHRAPDLVGAARRRGARPGALPAAQRRALPGPARGDHVHPRRGAARAISGPAAQAARDADPPEIPAVFIIGIGWTLDDGYPHEMRAADYDDWVTPTTDPRRPPAHGLNGDILVWNPVTRAATSSARWASASTPRRCASSWSSPASSTG